MNEEDKCALCTHRSAHNGSCLVNNEGCKFKPNAYCIMFTEELEKIKEEFEERILLNQTVAIQIMDKYISELKGENNG